MQPPDPYQFLSAEQIADLTNSPIENVRVNWPKIVEQLDHCGINEPAAQIAMMGTIAIETFNTFRPVREAFFLGEPAAENHRRTQFYYPYYGRGYIQLTHEGNYRRYGPRIAELWGAGGHEPDFNLVGEPDRALDPDISAAVSALYFRDHGGNGDALIVQAARARDWREVRRLVQGGSDKLDELIAIGNSANNLLA